MVLYNGNAEVVGNFRALNFYKASDIRIKEDIRKLIDGQYLFFRPRYDALTRAYVKIRPQIRLLK